MGIVDGGSLSPLGNERDMVFLGRTTIRIETKENCHEIKNDLFEFALKSDRDGFCSYIIKKKHIVHYYFT